MFMFNIKLVKKEKKIYLNVKLNCATSRERGKEVGLLVDVPTFSMIVDLMHHIIYYALAVFLSFQSVCTREGESKLY